MNDLLSLIGPSSPDLFATVSVLIAIIAMFFGTAGAIRTIYTSRHDLSDSSGDLQIIDQTPFERKVLERYYNQALTAANVSFWFSIIFAAIGFGVIIISFATHSPGDSVGTIIKILSGTVIDAVSGLFLIQSQNARKSMTDFFEKLRLDRLSAEARQMIEEIENTSARDQLRMQLVMKFSGIDRLIESDRAG